jgi:threonine aldolase
MIDLRSDTVTRPTPRMFQAMASAEVGDDVFGEDPTVNRLQELAAETFRREAALFVPTGTMGNQIALKIHSKPGQEVILESRSHVYNWEMAAMAVISGCIPRPLYAPSGVLRWEHVQSALHPPVYYRARVGLVVLENTHNMAGGTVTTSELTREVVDGAHQSGLPVHLDGARIFNAAAALNAPVSELADGCDSVMFCLSKGLAAPAGSLLVGSRDFIDEARSVRKMLGGGMRQAGVLAAAGIVALEEMPARLREDHANARLLAEALSENPRFSVDLDSVQTNIVMAEISTGSAAEAVETLRSKGILAVSTGPAQIRFVTHKDVGRQDVERAVQAIREIP